MRANVDNRVVRHTGQIVGHLELSTRVPIRTELNALTNYLASLIPAGLCGALDFVWASKATLTLVIQIST